MARRRGVMLVLIVPLAFAAVSFAGVPSFSIAQGPITSLTPSNLTVQANARNPTSCTRTSSSPAVAGFKVGDQITINCIQGVLVSIAGGLDKPRLGPVIPITGLPESHGGVPAPGPPPTHNQCAVAWNTTSPVASRQAIGALAPLGAFVGGGSSSLVSATPSHLVATGPNCVIWFVLPGMRTAELISVWKHRTAQDWQGFIEHGGGFGATRGILSQAIIKVMAETSQGWFWVSENGTLSSAH
jgi:hypothetical protein